MALTSPGVEVPVVDQSQYLPAPTNSVPFVLLATAQNKADPTGTGVAVATLAANANKLYQVTSQRDLVTLYGNPFFYTTSNGTPIQGYELNEYGLLAAYSLLGVTNRCYILRADIDLASLVGQTGRPTGAPDNGTYWLDTLTSTWGIYTFNQTTAKFTQQTPIVITDSTYLTGGYPLDSIGNIGDYAVNAIEQTGTPTSSPQYFYKTTANQWVAIASVDWKKNVPTVQGGNSNPSLTAGDTFTITLGTSLASEVSTTIAVPIAPNNTVTGVATAINNLGWGYLTAAVVDGKLCIYSSLIETSLTAPGHVTLAEGGGAGNTPLADMGITPGTYNQPNVYWSTSSGQPSWQVGQLYPRPTGSIWIKAGAAGSGMTPAMSHYNTTLASWVSDTVTLATSDWEVDSVLGPVSPSTIPAGTVYSQYHYDLEYGIGSPTYFFTRLATGPTVVTGTDTTPAFTTVGDYTLYVRVSTPNSSSLSTTVYTVSFATGSTATQFVTAWAAANIPNTSASVLTSGAIQIVHTEGGEIVIDDRYASGASAGTSNGFLSQAGFVAGTTTGCKYGPSYTGSFTPSGSNVTTTGSGTGFSPNVTTSYGKYLVDTTTFANSGSTYAVGDQITVKGEALGGSTPANNLVLEVASVSSGHVTGVAFVSGTAASAYTTQLSNWVPLTYTANEGALVANPADNTNWFYSVVDEVDIMVKYSGAWMGYGMQEYDLNGMPAPTSPSVTGGPTDPNGPIVSASEPTTQSDGTALVWGDLWIDTSNLENYPVIYRWQEVDTENKWVLLDNSDQTSSSGILFADARWATNGVTSVTNDPIPTIVSLLASDYTDLDAPEQALYPTGMLLFNTRRSGYNVKQFRSNYFNAASFPGASLPTERNAWVSASGLQSNGAPYMGRKAQRAMVVKALRASIDTNTNIRDEDNFFNLMATPNYPELQPNMVVLNADRGQTGYILGDTPMGLADDATAIQDWANNTAGATSTGEEGLVTRDTYLGLFYPSGIATDLSGNQVAVPASHMMLRTFLRSDTISYPWLAAAGTRRGIIDNALNIGYVNRQTGEFQVIKTRLGIRDVLYTNFINPLVFFTGNGLLNYGNKTSYNSSSALDRTNVARLIAYMRRQLTLAARPYVFEPNDAFTRGQISGTIETLMLDLVAKRGIYDYLVVCDITNNTPARIDRNELWVDVAIEPVKAAEFIYVPIRILNTGELAAL